MSRQHRRTILVFAASAAIMHFTTVNRDHRAFAQGAAKKVKVVLEIGRDKGSAIEGVTLKGMEFRRGDKRELKQTIALVTRYRDKKDNKQKYQLAVQIPFGHKPTVKLKRLRREPTALRMIMTSRTSKEGLTRLRFNLRPVFKKGALDEEPEAPCCIECDGVLYCKSPELCIMCFGFEICCKDLPSKATKRTPLKTKKKLGAQVNR